MEGREAQVVVSLGTDVVVPKVKAGAEGMAQVGRAPEEVVAHPHEKLKGGKPRWQRSSPGKEGERVAGFPRGTGHQHEGERDNPSG